MNSHATDMGLLTPDAGEALLRECGIMPTQQRVEIARQLLGRHQHVTADTLLSRVNQAGVTVSKATVYNTLRLFAEHGLLRELIVDSSKTFFDSNIAAHHHFYDPDNGELIDIGVDEITVENVPTPPDGRDISDIEVVVRLTNKGL
ncbi:MAG: transcriptional repressor [Thiotrichales bacterium]|nr:transcriptional repressor [Thiotrichales bacterium]|tara:strand:- start:469 stop:906 length:438 start_codon:yes stop_codon:yes gene_type:complete